MIQGVKVGLCVCDSGGLVLDFLATLKVGFLFYICFFILDSKRLFWLDSIFLFVSCSRGPHCFPRGDAEHGNADFSNPIISIGEGCDQLFPTMDLWGRRRVKAVRNWTIILVFCDPWVNQQRQDAGPRPTNAWFSLASALEARDLYSINFPLYLRVLGFGEASEISAIAQCAEVAVPTWKWLVKTSRRICYWVLQFGFLFHCDRGEI